MIYNVSIISSKCFSYLSLNGHNKVKGADQKIRRDQSLLLELNL